LCFWILQRCTLSALYLTLRCGTSALLDPSLPTLWQCVKKNLNGKYNAQVSQMFAHDARRQMYERLCHEEAKEGGCQEEDARICYDYVRQNEKEVVLI